MKIMSLVTAGLVSIAGFAPVAIATPAFAQHRTEVHRTVVRETRPAIRNRTRQVCTKVQRNHRTVRRCRTVRR